MNMNRKHIIVLSIAVVTSLVAIVLLLLNQDDQSTANPNETTVEVAPKSPYLSPDLQMELAKGNVARIGRSCRYDGGFTAVVFDKYYDENGFFDEVKSDYPERTFIENAADMCRSENADVLIQRNDKNQIVLMEDNLPINENSSAENMSDCAMFKTKFTWIYDDDGFVTQAKQEFWDGSIETQFVYNDQRELIREESVTYNLGFVTQNNITYSNIEYDDHDNWISRDVHQILLEGVKGQPEYMMRRDEYDYQEVREIEYY